MNSILLVISYYRDFSEMTRSLKPKA